MKWSKNGLPQGKSPKIQGVSNSIPISAILIQVEKINNKIL
jgi:hypothetical protein